MAREMTRAEYEKVTEGIGMKCSELIHLLSGYISKHGDLPITIHRKRDETTRVSMNNLEIVVTHDMNIDKVNLDFLLIDRF